MADDVISRADARAQGLKYYFTGIPCKHGHVAPRSTKNLGCKTCSYERNKAYTRKNREHCRRRDQEYKDKTRSHSNELARKRYAANPTKFVDKTKRYYDANGDKVRKRRKAYHHRIYPVDECVRKQAVERSAQWAKDNPEKRRAQLLKQKARRRSAEGSHTGDDILEILKLQKGRCAYCRAKLTKYQVDHIIALANGGTNFRKNIQIACGPCNRTKSDKDPIDFARSLGRLL